MSDELEDIDYDSWVDGIWMPMKTFQERLVSLKDVRAGGCTDMHRAIEILGRIGRDIWNFVNEVDMGAFLGMDREDMLNFVKAYDNQLKRLKELEGVDCSGAAESLANCVRLAMLFLSYMRGFYNKLWGAKLLPTLAVVELLP